MKAIDIKITVHGQTVTAEGAATVMSGSRNLYRLAFEFEKPAEAARYVQIEKDGERSVYLPIDGEPVALPNEFCAREGVIRVSVFADDLITTNAAALPVIRSAYSADVPAEGEDETGALRKCVFTPTDETAVTVLKKDAEGFKAFCGGEYVRVGSKNDYTDADKALVSLIPSKADEADLEDCLTTVGNILRDKVDKIEGKGLSTNDYTDADVKWLNTDIPEILTEDYSNIINLSQKINLKEDKVEGKGLSTNDYTDADKAEVAKVANKLDKPAKVTEGLLGFNFAGVETIKGITGAGVSVEIDPSQIPNNKALKEYVASKTVNYLSKPTSNGIVGYMSGIGSLTYTLNTSMPEKPSHAGILSAKAVYDYINGLDASEVSY